MSEKKAEKELKRRVKQARKEKRDEVHCDDIGLGTLSPAAAEALAAFRGVGLAGNRLSALPQTCATLWGGVERLSLARNAFLHLPERLPHATLRVLDIADNRLEALPPEIASLRALETLNLAGNAFASLPAALAACGALRELDVSRCKVRSVDADRLAAATRLRRLALAHNLIDELPPDFAASAPFAASLTALDVSFNRVAELPDSVAGLVALERLDVSFNALQGPLPLCLARLPRLAALEANGNRITALPVAFAALPQLRRLGLAKNELAELPRELGDMPALESLDVSENRLTEVPFELVALEPTLREFLVAGNPLRADFEGAVSKGTTQALLAHLRKLEQQAYIESPKPAVSGAQPGVASMLLSAANPVGRRFSGSSVQQKHPSLQDLFAAAPQPQQQQQQQCSLPMEAFLTPTTPRRWQRADAADPPKSATGRKMPLASDPERGLKAVLADPLGFQSFREFLTEEHCEENLVFWSDVERFRMLAPGSEALASEARRLYERYICDTGSAKSEVNVPGTVKQRIRKAVIGSAAQPTTATFDEAQKNVFDLMALDSFPRFVRSHFFEIWDGIRHAKR